MYQKLGNVDNQAVSAGVDILGSGNKLTPIRAPALVHMWVTFADAGVLTKRRTLQSGAVISEDENDSQPLGAGAEFEFGFVIDQGEVVDFRYSVNSTCRKMIACEDTGGAD